MRRFILVATILFLSTTAITFGADIQFEVSCDKTRISLGEVAQLNLTFHGAQNIPAPKLEKIDGFELRYQGPSSMVSIVNGVVSASITHVYTLLPLKTGRFTLGPFHVQIQGKTLSSKPITIEVVSGSTGPASSPQGVMQDETTVAINEEALKDKIFLVLEIAKRRCYLNEIIPIRVKLYVNNLAVRDIQPPSLSSTDFSVEKFEQSGQYKEEIGGVVFDVLEFTTNMVAIKPGEFRIGPAQLNCNLVVRKGSRRPRRSIFDDDFFSGFFSDDIFEDFFGRFVAYPLQLQSADIPITVLALPEEKRPADFSGALGNFTLEVEASPLQVNSGDPITLRMVVKGEGNFDSVKPPQLKDKKGFKVYDPQVKQNSNKKIFEQVLIPESENITQIPEVVFSFFDTNKGEYVTLTRGPISIKVSPAPEQASRLIELPQNQTTFVPNKEELGKGIVYLKGSLGRLKRQDSYLYKNTLFWLINILFFLDFWGLVGFYAYRRKLNQDPRYARRLLAPALAKRNLRQIEKLLQQGKSEEFLDLLFKTMRDYLANRFHLSYGAVTLEKIEEIFSKNRLDPQVLEKLKGLFVFCDMARYAPAEIAQEKLSQAYLDLREGIEYLERCKVC